LIANLLKPEVQQFIIDHEHADEKALLLKGSRFEGVETKVLVEQIVGRRKARLKLPTFYNTKDIIYPPGVNLEQSSSEQTALFKASVVKKLLANEGKNELTLVDLTGGFGVDSFYFSRSIRKVHYVEQSISLLKIAQFNHQTLNALNITHHHNQAENFIEGSGRVDCIYVDPSRRSNENNKLYKLANCEPNVVSLLPSLLEKSKIILIKVSPWLDIKQGLLELAHVKTVFVVSVDNDCKELLFVCEKKCAGNPEVTAVNLQKSNNDMFSFNFEEEALAKVNYSLPQKYLFEPNTSILKAGAFKLVGLKFNLSKIEQHTHFYTSESDAPHFPGRAFKIIARIKPDSKAAKEFCADGKANVITRNYPLTPTQLLAKLKLKEGGHRYLIGFSNQQEKFLLVCERLR
jgi:16S rRNA G966 N2-methylase RsmD